MRSPIVFSSTFCVAALATTVVHASLIDSLVNRMVFLPSPGIDYHPSQLGLEAEDVFLETEDGIRIHAFWIPARGADRAFLFFHGNAGNASHRLPNAARLQALGAHVLLLDYRGYGLSEGRPSERGVYADARAAFEHLVVERGIQPGRIVLFGRSIGAAVAVELGRRKRLAGVILESAFTSAEDIARKAFGWPLSTLARNRFDSASKIDEIEAPLLFFHGDADGISPIELGRALYDVAPEPKVFEVLHGAGHNDTVQVGGRAYFRRIGEFLEQVTGG